MERTRVGANVFAGERWAVGKARTTRVVVTCARKRTTVVGVDVDSDEGGGGGASRRREVCLDCGDCGCVHNAARDGKRVCK